MASTLLRALLLFVFAAPPFLKNFRPPRIVLTGMNLAGIFIGNVHNGDRRIASANTARYQFCFEEFTIFASFHLPPSALVVDRRYSHPSNYRLLGFPFAASILSRREWSHRLPSVFWFALNKINPILIRQSFATFNPPQLGNKGGSTSFYAVVSTHIPSVRG